MVGSKPNEKIVKYSGNAAIVAGTSRKAYHGKMWKERVVPADRVEGGRLQWIELLRKQ